MKAKAIVITIMVISLLFIGIGCSNVTKTQQGAVLGTATGATAGAILDKHHRVRGGIIGGIIGGVTGAYVGKLEDREDAHKRNEEGYKNDSSNNEAYNDDSNSLSSNSENYNQYSYNDTSSKQVIYFDANSSRLKNDAYSEIRNTATQLNNSPNLNVQIKGYADTNGMESNNMSLAIDRAKAVKVALVEEGVDASRINTTSDVEQSYEATEYDTQVNRKVEIIIIP
jgi:outer membrane protein OmpA-like peptidoglycan-associated protein